MNSNSAAADNTAGKAAWICLAIAWVAFIVPFPGTGLLIGWPLNLVAFILAIVAMAKSGSSAGLWQLLASIIVSPIIYFIGVAVLAGMLGLGQPSSSPLVSAPNASSSPATALPTATPTSPPPVPSTQWLYKQFDDPMGKGTTYGAIIQSSNSVEFRFPYSGPQHAILTLRSNPRIGKDVIFSIERGQILCPSYRNCTVLVRFDDREAQNFSASGAADNSTETIFIHNYSRFVSNMQRAKTVRISVNIYQQGSPVFEFDVSGFDQSKYIPK